MYVKWIFKLYQALLFFLFLESLNAWFTWDINNYLKLSYLVISVIFFSVNKGSFEFRRYRLHILLYISAMLSVGITFDVGGIIGFVCTTVPIIMFIATKRSFKLQTLRTITRWWLYILIPSLGLFLLSFIVELPNAGVISYPASEAYVYTNYILLIKGAFYNIRFNSIFLEPGHLGMIISFFLYAYRFDFSRREVRWLFLIEIFTLSLAGYVLVLIGYIFSMFARRKGVVKFMTILVSLLVSIYWGAIVYNDGRNMLNELIIGRLAFDEEKGIAGNNRFSDYADELLDEKIKSFEIWGGTQKNKVENINLGAGWKVFFIKYGLISMILFLLFYYGFVTISKDRRFVVLFIILLCFAFLQRAYPYWFAWHLVFLSGVARNDIEQMRKMYKKRSVLNFSTHIDLQK